MLASHSRSRAARCGLLIVAVIHLVTAATLPFTHAHLPPDAAAGPVVAAAEGESGSLPVHADICVICQAFGSAHVTHTPAQTFAAGTAAQAAVVLHQTKIVAPAYSSSHPRAPPRA
jgi:hypothetical protein